MKMKKLGDRIKQYELQTCGNRLMSGIPIICRIDGRSFHTFTKGLKKPYDERLSNLMVETSLFLCKETNANCVYTQSDEISLIWYSDDIKSQNLFNGKIFKLTSILASLTTGYFNKELPNYIPEKSHLIPTFDCRVFNVPTLEESSNYFYWRELDATKNSITMASSEYYSHKFLHGKNSSEKQELLFQKGINWNDYPEFFKRGTYIQRKRVLTKFSVEEIENLPPKHNARKNPDMEIERWVIKEVNLPPISKIKNRVDVIIFGNEPEIGE